MTDKVTIHAVHERDAKQLWNKLKLKPVEKCFICGKDVTYENFNAILPWTKDNERIIAVVCDSGRCFFEMTIKRRNAMIGGDKTGR